jgi:hypothetical protein
MKLKPVNVTPEEADTYLEINGWIRDPVVEGNWRSPDAPVSVPRGQAVLAQFEKNFVSLAFVMQHIPPELLASLIPPAVMAQVMELKSRLTRDPTN